MLCDLLLALSFAGLIAKHIAISQVLGLDMVMYVSKYAFTIEGLVVYFSDKLQAYLKH